MGTGALISRAPEFVYYNPRFFQFSGHFPTSRGPVRFFVPDLPRVPEVPEIPHGDSDLHFLPSFAFPRLVWHDPR